jgi:hypothetical protein
MLTSLECQAESGALQTRLGGVVSWTVTDTLAVADRPPPSVTVRAIVLVPSGHANVALTVDAVPHGPLQANVS